MTITENDEQPKYIEFEVKVNTNVSPAGDYPAGKLIVKDIWNFWSNQR